MSNSEDKSKTNVAADPLQRLASFKAPRDLTLGGLKPNKKIFTPNLNVTRNKNKSIGASNSHKDGRVKKEEKNKRDRKNDRNKNFKNGPNVIKSTGVFSEGLGSVERSHQSRVSYSRNTESTPTTLQKPTIKIKDIVKIDYEYEEQKIREAYGGDWYDAESENFSNPKNPSNASVKSKWSSWSKKHMKSEPMIKQEVFVKQEPSDDDEDVDDDDDDDDNQPVSIAKKVAQDTDVPKLLQTDKPTLLFLQLPDILPGHGSRNRDQPSTSTENADKPVDNRCRLKDLDEGKIGKMRVHRSGRVTLMLGDTLFEVCAGIRSSCVQEVVSTAVDDPSRSASITSLGQLDHKLVITPHWESIFEKMSM
ncbi:unnamed protein product [Euphydryas editha]|uniref:DNA-directed RNA polymerase III subunit RPC4 n=1 Tax=Euphydryas editha TaxID=104508 RepID=A0AAU9U7R0_EUPED|nr:unnamed protein product [Euphydryas editha]